MICNYNTVFDNKKEIAEKHEKFFVSIKFITFVIMEQIRKEVQDKLNLMFSYKLAPFCRDANISAPTVVKVMKGEHVSEGTIYKLKSILDEL